MLLVISIRTSVGITILSVWYRVPVQNPIKKTILSRVCVYVCMSQHRHYRRERKKQKIQNIKSIKSLHTNIMYVRSGTLRKWYYFVRHFFHRIHMYVRTDLHTSIKLFVVPRESTDF